MGGGKADCMSPPSRGKNRWLFYRTRIMLSACFSADSPRLLRFMRKERHRSYGAEVGKAIRSTYPGHQRLSREGLDIWMTHIGGYPGNYARHVKPGIFTDPPGLFISGHSHILKVMPDKKNGFLHMNPGSAGRNGLHKVRTLLRFEIQSGRVNNVDVIELGPRSADLL